MLYWSQRLLIKQKEVLSLDRQEWFQDNNIVKVLGEGYRGIVCVRLGIIYMFGILQNFGNCKLDLGLGSSGV